MAWIGWPRVIGFAALAGLVAGTACAPAVGQRPARAGMGAKAERGKIKFFADSHVCITSAMDVTFWSNDPAKWETGQKAGASLSGVLQRTLIALYTEQSGVDYSKYNVFLPMREPHAPECSGERDINIFVDYRKSKRGKPFVIQYIVKQGIIEPAGLAERDIDAERKAGKYPIFEELGGLDAVIVEDLKNRASDIAKVFGAVLKQ